VKWLSLVDGKLLDILQEHEDAGNSTKQNTSALHNECKKTNRESVVHFVLNLKIQESDFSKFETRQLIEPGRNPTRTGLITVTMSLIAQQIQ
jgi:hypothetical protein